MSSKPIHLVTHPRACSTAFERLFLHRTDTTCLHEPFDEAYYRGPERLHWRNENEAEPGPTYKEVLDMIDDCQSKHGKRAIVKTMARHLIPPDGKAASIAPSLLAHDHPTQTQITSLLVDNHGTEQESTREHTEHNGDHTSQNGYHTSQSVKALNPSVIPAAKLQELHHTFLIRNPRLSVPSVYRLSMPQKSHVTKWFEFSMVDTGYRELHLLFDFLKSIGQIGPKLAGNRTRINDEEVSAGAEENVDICLVDADDFLENPAKIAQLYCASVGLSYDPAMLDWDSSESRQKATAKFERFPGFHDEAMNSNSVKPRKNKSYQTQSIDELHQEWIREFGKEGSDIIREAVEANMVHYEYLKQFAMKV